MLLSRATESTQVTLHYSLLFVLFNIQGVRFPWIKHLSEKKSKQIFSVVVLEFIGILSDSMYNEILFSIRSWYSKCY